MTLDETADQTVPRSTEETVDQIAEALREDPVLVHPTFGNGRTDEVDAALGEIVDGLGYPAYVVLHPGPETLSANQPDRDLAVQLQQRLGVEDAVFYVHTDPQSYSNEIVSFGDVPDSHLAIRAAMDLDDSFSANLDLNAAGRAARDLEVLDSGGELGRREYFSYEREELWQSPVDWDPSTRFEATPGDPWAVATMGFLVVTGAGFMVLHRYARARREGRSLLPWPERDRGPAGVPVSPAEVRVELEAELEQLAALRAKTPDGGLTQEQRILADGSCDTARRLVRAPRGDEDLVGALVLVRIADTELRARGRPGQRGRAPYRPCFIDPRHGRATGTHEVVAGSDRLDVPTCADCTRTRGDRRPMMVRGGLLRRERPWFEKDTVWARTGYGGLVDELWRHVDEDLEGR